jgi:hypothetical protein
MFRMLGAARTGGCPAQANTGPASRGGLNQQSDHSKHNDTGAKRFTSLNSVDRPNRSNPVDECHQIHERREPCPSIARATCHARHIRQ